MRTQPPSRRTAALLASVAAATLAGAAAQAQDGDLPPVEKTFANGSVLRLYGQINKGVLSYDDGVETKSYGLVDNNNAQSRIGTTYTQAFGDWTFQNVNEIGYSPYSTANVNVLNPSPSDADYEFTNANIRKLDFTFASDTYGKFWIGQGSMATDGPYELDLSGTGVIAYVSVGDTAAGQIIRFSGKGLSFDDSLSGIQIGDAFTDYNGPRRVRVRYDTPTYANFTFATSFGRNLLSDDSDVRDENIADASITYENTFGDVETQAGLGYYWQQDNISTWGGSATALHKPTGLNFTVAGGLGSPNDGPNGSYWYVKGGLLRDYISWGQTAVSLDYYSGNDFYVATDLGATSSTSKSWGLALVQNIDALNTQLWLTARDYEYSDNSGNSYEDGQAIFGGAIFQF